VASVQDRGADLRQFCSEMVEHIRNVLVAKVVPGADDLIEVAPEELAETKADAARLTVEQAQELFRIFNQTEEGLRASQHPWYLMELAIIRACRLPSERGDSAKPNPAASAAPPAARPAPSAAGITVANPPPRPSLRTGVSSSPSEAGQPMTNTGSNRADSDAVTLDWEAVVARVYAARPNVGAYLEESALISTERDQLTIGYPSSAGALVKMIQDNYQQIIQDVCKTLAGRTVRLKFVTLDAGSSVATIAQKRREREAATEQRLRQEALANPLLQEALTVFSGEVKEVRKRTGPPGQLTD
jgi:DNA polymerase-3 subunit gamma/tau